MSNKIVPLPPTPGEKRRRNRVKTNKQAENTATTETQGGREVAPRQGDSLLLGHLARAQEWSRSVSHVCLAWHKPQSGPRHNRLRSSLTGRESDRKRERAREREREKVKERVK